MGITKPESITQDAAEKLRTVDPSREDSVGAQRLAV